MPRPNPTRSLRSETNLAKRIAHEREQRGMTYDGLAKRMTDAGCPIQPSAIYKIEKADPPRRITVDEVVAFAVVFETSVEDLLKPLELLQAEGLRVLLDSWERAKMLLQIEVQMEESMRDKVRQYVEDHPGMDEHLQRFVREWVDASARATWPDPDTAEAYWMQALTGSVQWSERLLERLEREDPSRG